MLAGPDGEASDPEISPEVISQESFLGWIVLS
jgi:hypothetical protein